MILCKLKNSNFIYVKTVPETLNVFFSKSHFFFKHVNRYEQDISETAASIELKFYRLLLYAKFLSLIFFFFFFLMKLLFLINKKFSNRKIAFFYLTAAILFKNKI